eukprot:GHRR01006014.1.p1 GENE.GHRR01006014.1~~GHRR01006014.1.p1  ORF type:complete len:111 (-),score=43.05 GHRR01006014.1:1658-1990(-)
MPLLLLLQMQPRLSAGAGWSGRNAESGMLLINRHQWLEVLHWVFWINSWADKLYQKLLHGDKDTFALGFALAGAASSYRQVGIMGFATVSQQPVMKALHMPKQVLLSPDI